MRIGVGIDVGAKSIHAVRIDGRPGSNGAVSDKRLFASDNLAGVIEFCRGSSGIAIDAPEDWSIGVHRDDSRVSAKFRTARCCEVAARPAVPWVTPMRGSEVAPWMAVGFALWSALERAGHLPMEVFPAGCFFRLNGARWPARKTSTEGRKQRIDLLRPRVALPPDSESWRHDFIDATVAALVGFQGSRAERVVHDCGASDGSAMWFPTA